MPRSSSYYKPQPREAKVDEVLAQRIKHVIEDEPYLGYRMVWATLRSEGILVNRKAVQRVMQLKRWQCHRRLHKSCYPRVEARALHPTRTSAGRPISPACGPNTTA